MAADQPTPRDPLLASILDGTGDRTLRLFGARGQIPLTPDDRLRVFLATRHDSDAQIAREAEASLAVVAPDEWLHFLRASHPSADELDVLASNTQDPAVLEEIVRNRNTPNATLTRLARTADGSVQEALVVNQARLLQWPDLMDVLLANPSLSLDSRRRLLELREEFFEKKERREAAAVEAAAQPSEEELPEPPPEEEEAAGEEPAEALAEEEPVRGADGKELYQKILYMTVAEKIQTALKGTREERRILITDVSKVVVESVLRCPKLSDIEVAGFAGMRNVDEDVFRKISANREWVKKYNVVNALVRNPKVPPDVSLNLVKFLRIKDLKLTAEDRDLSEAVRVGARKLYRIKRGG